MTDATREALQLYKEAWKELTAPALVVVFADDHVNVTGGAAGTELLATPVLIHYRPQVSIALRRPPPWPERKQYDYYTVEFEYTVTREGRATDIAIVASGAPRTVQAILTENMRLRKFRPRFVNGEPVDTPGMHNRQGVYVID